MLQGFVTLWLVTVVVFTLVRLSGDPLDLLVDVTASDETRNNVRESLGLDGSVLTQYQRFVGNLLQGDLGESVRLKRPVTELILPRFWKTAQLGLAAIGMSVVVGIPLGIVAAVRRGGLADRAINVLAYVGMSAPAFWLGLMLVLIFSVRLDLLPTSGYGGPTHFILPTITLGYFVTAGIIRLVRASMLEALATDYILLAKAKGLHPVRVLVKHALRTALIPVVTFAGVLFVQTIAGSIVVETVFAWPGLGQLAYNSVLTRDYPLVQGIVLLVALLFVSTNIFLDLLYTWLDPRIRLVS